MWQINCTMFKDGKCLHQAAPRELFGTAICILQVKFSDPRVPPGCALQQKLHRPFTINTITR